MKVALNYDPNSGNVTTNDGMFIGCCMGLNFEVTGDAMQYLLNADELATLQQRAIAAEVKNKTELQELCTLAAIHVPVPRPWADDKTPAPWGCILSAEHDPGYCDDCPARKLCPYERKRYSK